MSTPIPTVVECHGCSEMMLAQELDDDELYEACADQKQRDSRAGAIDRQTDHELKRLRGQHD